LKEFDRYVSKKQAGKTVIGDVLGVFDKNFRREQACKVLWVRSESGIQVLQDLPFVWVHFRLPVPVLTGSKWDATRVYAAGQQAYYRSPNLTGNFYSTPLGAAAGESPESAAARWELVQIPAAFKSYLEHGAAADYLMPEGEETAAPHRGMAEAALADQAAVLLGQEEQTQRLEVQTR
jgi:hypothetical protein